MSKPQQVFNSFVNGDLYHAESGLLVNRLPFLNILIKDPWSSNHRISHQLNAALRVGTAIVFPETLKHEKVREWLMAVEAVEMDTDHYQAVREMIISNCVDFSLACLFLDKGFCQRDLCYFADVLRQYGLESPYGTEPEDFLRYINREFSNGVFTAAVNGLLKGRNRGWIEGTNERVDRLACGRKWTLFKDETEAMMERLSDDSGRLQFFKL